MNIEYVQNAGYVVQYFIWKWLQPKLNFAICNSRRYSSLNKNTIFIIIIVIIIISHCYYENRVRRLL